MRVLEKVSSKIVVLTLRSVIAALGKLPVSFRRGLATPISAAMQPLVRRDRYMAELQLKSFLPEANAHAVARDSIKSVVTTLLESLNLVPILKNARFAVTGFNEASMLAQNNKGALVLTGHVGNWDLFGAWAVKNGIPLVAVGRVARSQILQDLLAWMRERYGIITLWRGSSGGGRACLELIRQGKFVATLIDQDTRVRTSMVPFFGELAATPSTLVELAFREHVPCFAAFLYRSGENYAIAIDRIDQDADSTETLLLRYNQCLENVIKKHPEQWVWFHKRWRTRDRAERLSGKRYQEWLEQRA